MSLICLSDEELLALQRSALSCFAVWSTCASAQSAPTEAPVCHSQLPTLAAMPQQSKDLTKLTEVPAAWPLATVIDAFVYLAAYCPGQAPDRAREAVSFRLVELWASQPEEAQAWLERCRERFAAELAAQATRREKLCEALLRHGAAEWGKYGAWRFSEAGLRRGEPGPAAEQERAAACYLQESYSRPRCRELAERLEQAESQETARKRQKLEEETAERRRLEAELQKSQQEECRALRNRLAAAEAEVSSKDAELQTVRSESATRTAAAESAVAEMRKELQHSQEEHSKCQEHCEQLANRLKEAEAEAPSDASEKQVEVQQLKEESRSRSHRQHTAAQPSSAEDAGSKMELQLEKAVLQERCEQLRQQLKQTSAKAEVERSAMLGQMQVLWEEKGTYKERIRELERQLFQAESGEAPQFGGVLSGHPTLARHGVTFCEVASGGQESDLAERLGYSLVDDVGDDVVSIQSGASQWSVKQHCFMSDAIFKTCSGDANFYLMGKNLKKGSQVVAGDGKTLLEVAASPEICPATEVVDLHAAGGATLCVTPDHPVQVPDARGELDKILYIRAGQLKVGDSVVLDSGEAAELTKVNLQATECEVLKIVFEPDLPVAVFSPPPCIQSKGHKKKPSTRRAGQCRKGKAVVDPADGAGSIPDTAVGSARIEMDLC